MVSTTIEDVEDFLDQKRIAFVGVSRNPKDFSRSLFRDLRRQGYTVIPVNRQMPDVEGSRCFPRVQDVTPPVDGALIMTPAAKSEHVVRDCAQAGVSRVWLHRGTGTGSVSAEALNLCQKLGIRAVAGYCPYMCLAQTPFFHRFHGFWMKLTGAYPAACH
jgi:predicted CoA-binding protein